MTWYQDLTACDYFGSKSKARLLAVGWLERGHAYPNGQLDDLRPLFELCRKPWQPTLFLGWHDCSLCDSAEGPGSFEADGESVNIGTYNLFVPDLPSDCIYVAPTMILHYIEAHNYLPPEGFLEAVQCCPKMGSDEYFQALKTVGRG